MKKNFFIKHSSKNKPMHRIFIKVVNKHAPLTVDKYGQKWIPVEWVEVGEINLGSMKHPNKDVLGFRFEPIIYEREERD